MFMYVCGWIKQKKKRRAKLNYSLPINEKKKGRDSKKMGNEKRKRTPPGGLDV